MLLLGSIYIYIHTYVHLQSLQIFIGIFAYLNQDGGWEVLMLLGMEAFYVKGAVHMNFKVGFL